MRIDKEKNYDIETVIMTCDLIIEHSINLKYKKYHFLLLKKMFNNFFTGQYFLNGIKFIEKDENRYELIILEFKLFIKIYTIVNYNWADIKEILSVIDVTNNKYKFERPGDILAYLLLTKHKRWTGKSSKTKTKTAHEYLYRAWCEYIKSINNKKLSKKCQILIERLKKRKIENKDTSDILLLDVILEVIPKIDRKTLENQRYLLNDRKIRLLRHMF